MSKIAGSPRGPAAPEERLERVGEGWVKKIVLKVLACLWGPLCGKKEETGNTKVGNRVFVRKAEGFGKLEGEMTKREGGGERGRKKKAWVRKGRRLSSKG